MSQEAAFAKAYTDLWANGDPTETWQPYVDATHQAFDDGAKVVLLSGRHGVGKSSLYASMFGRSITDFNHRYLDTFLDYPEVYESIPSTATICLDEVSGVIAHPGGTEATSTLIAHGVAVGQRFVAILPGDSRRQRVSFAQSLEQSLTESGIPYVNTGDVVETKLRTARVAKACQQLGVAKSAIDTLDTVSSLRIPRLFNTIMMNVLHDSALADRPIGDTLTSDYIRQIIENRIMGHDEDDGDYDETDLYFPVSQHMILRSMELTSAATSELYEFAGHEVPSPGNNTYKFSPAVFNKD